MPRLPDLGYGETTPLIRTDFTDDAAWQRVVAVICAPALFEGEDGTYQPAIAPLSDPAFAGVTAAGLAAHASADNVGYALLADAASMSSRGDLTVEYVDLSDAPGAAFRCAAGEVALIEANLSISNMDFEEFASGVGPDGVFRGFAD